MQEKVNIIILNWNGWADTIACLESLLRSSYTNYSITIVDNHSTDGSVEHIINWAKGNLNIIKPKDNIIKPLVYPPILKPIHLNCIDYNESGQIPGYNFKKNTLTLLQSAKNLGFGGGNNIGLKFGLLHGDFDHFWILNNDTIVEHQALGSLVETARYYTFNHKKVGMIGSKLKCFNQPDLIQSIGGCFNKITATITHRGSLERDVGQYDGHHCDTLIDYPIGASLFISKTFLDNVGLICEDHFLYFEEIEWAVRAKKQGWMMGYNWEGVIYHKKGVSTLSSSNLASKSCLADYCYLRSRILLARKLGGILWVSVFLATLVSLLKRLLYGRTDLVKNGLQAMMDAYGSSGRQHLPR
jgi:hypothetical protein